MIASSVASSAMVTTGRFTSARIAAAVRESMHTIVTPWARCSSSSGPYQLRSWYRLSMVSGK